MKSDSSGGSDLERVIGKAAVEAARMSSQASQAAKKILGDVTSEFSEAKSFDQAPIDLIETEEELIALVALPGSEKESIDLRVTEDSLYVDARMAVREGRYLQKEIGTLPKRREIRLSIEIKTELVRASFKDGILEVHLPKLVVINAKRIQVE